MTILETAAELSALTDIPAYSAGDDLALLELILKRLFAQEGDGFLIASGLNAVGRVRKFIEENTDNGDENE